MSLLGSGLLFRKVAYAGELEHLALQSLYDEHGPDRDKGQAHYHGQQPDEQVAEPWNEKHDEACNPEQCSPDHSDQPQSETLKGMKADETIPAIGLDEEKNYSRDDGEVGQGCSEIFRKRTHGAAGALD